MSESDDALEAAITALERLRGTIPNVDEQIASLRRLASGGHGATVSTDHSVAVGTMSHSTVVIGDVQGGVYAGPAPRDSKEALGAYRRVLVSGARHLPLRGVDVGAVDPSAPQHRFELSAVYVDLETRPSRIDLHVPPGQMRLVKTEQWSLLTPQVLDMVITNRRLVLLGDPGSGKSTFMNHLLLCLAAHGVEPDGRWLSRLPRWPADEADILPVPVLLRDFARSMTRGASAATPNPLVLWRFIMKRLADQNLGAAEEAIHHALEHGRAILLLDGLDEVPTSAERAQVRGIVDAFARRYPNARLLVTCRTLSYKDPSWQLEGLLSAEIAPFDRPRIDRFIDAWYSELRRMGVVRADEATRLSQALREAVQRKDLSRLAPNPLLLTVMALVHTHKGRLPDARARLYEDTVDLLLWRWDELRAAGSSEDRGLRRLLREAQCQDVDLHRTLWQLAYEAHAQANPEEEALADIAEHRLEIALANLHPKKSRDWAMQLVEVMKLRAGLLLERSPGVYTFPHRTFQEYLAGAYLAARANFATEASALDVVQWREVILLAVGKLVYVNLEVDRPLLLALAFCGHESPRNPAHVRRSLFAAEILIEIGIERILQNEQGVEIADRVRHRLLSLMADVTVEPGFRVEAAELLGHIGDPRFDERAYWLPSDPERGFVEIPQREAKVLEFEAIVRGPRAPSANLFRHVLRKLRREPMPRELVSDEIARFLDAEGDLGTFAALPRESTAGRYFISRYPVTVEQFNAFLTDVGQTPLQRSRRSRHCPVVDVPFKAAVLYCEWLSLRLAIVAKSHALVSLLHEGWRLLPCSRSEWAKALFPVDALPWGAGEKRGASNSLDTGVRWIAPVGAFPETRTKEGVDDLIGNVWEYMRDFEGYTVSGGCYSTPQLASVLEARRNSQPTGFRLVLTDARWNPPPLPFADPDPEPDKPTSAAIRRG